MHEKFSPQGFVLLGVNCADNKEIAKAFMRENGATFPTVLDTSIETSMFVHRDYKITAYPQSYLIDRDGKIAAAWVGYSDSDPTPTNELAKLGIK